MSFLRRVFLNKSGVRSGWRWFAFGTGGLVLTLLGAIVAGVFMTLVGPPDSPASQTLLMAPAFVAFPLWSMACALLFGEGLRGSGLGGPWLRSIGEWLAGAVLGGALILLGVALVAAIGLIVPDVSVTLVRSDEAQWLDLLLWVPALLLMSLWEEAFFRGYGLMWAGRSLGNGLSAVLPTGSARQQQVVHTLGTLPPLLLSCIFFALIHLGNPSNSGMIPTINTALAGLWLAIPVYRSRALHMSWGLHFGWNACMGLGLGIEVSGVEMGRVLHTTLAGPDWISGGGYGLEGSVAGTLVLVLGILLVLLTPRRSASESAWALVTVHDSKQRSHPNR